MNHLKSLEQIPHDDQTVIPEGSQGLALMVQSAAQRAHSASQQPKMVASNKRILVMRQDLEHESACFSHRSVFAYD